jgi:hypothetical protein
MRKHLAHLGLGHEYDYNPEISLKEKMVRYMLYLYIPGVELVHETQDFTCKNKEIQSLAPLTILRQNG